MYHVKSYRDAHDVQSHISHTCSTLLGGGIAQQILCLHPYMYAWTGGIGGFIDAFESAAAWLYIFFASKESKMNAERKKTNNKTI